MRALLLLKNYDAIVLRLAISHKGTDLYGTYVAGCKESECVFDDLFGRNKVNLPSYKEQYLFLFYYMHVLVPEAS